MTAEPANADRQLDFHPGMGMRWEVTRGVADASPEMFEATNWLDPQMPGPPVHVHPNSEESFEVLEGALDVQVDGEWSTITAGQTATVAAGVPHTLRNGTNEPVTVITRISPAGRSEEMFRTMQRMIEDGKVTRLPPDGPRSAIYTAMLFGAYPEEIKMTKPPNGVFSALALVGRTLGMKIEPPPE